MFNFLMQLEDFYLFVLLSVTFVIVSILCTFMARRIIPSHVRAQDNAVIVGTNGLIGVIYGVLVGISALYLINNNSYTADAVQREANAVADVYRDSQWLPATVKNSIAKNLENYLHSVIDDEWPLMSKGLHVDNRNDFLINSMIAEVVNNLSTNNTELLLEKNILSNLQNLYNARQQRIHMSYELLDPDMWVVIIIGTILLLFINFIYEMNFFLHVVAVTSAALMASSMLFLLITLDGPFQGEFAIKPGAMQSVLLFMEQAENKLPNKNAVSAG